MQAPVQELEAPCFFFLNFLPGSRVILHLTRPSQGRDISFKGILENLDDGIRPSTEFFFFIFPKGKKKT